MSRLLLPFTDRASWRRLAFLISALPLAGVWLGLLVAVWTLTLALAITPLVVPALIGLGFAVRGGAAAEAALSRELLDADVRLSPPPRARGFWGRAWVVLADPFVWKAQAYLIARLTVGLAIAVGILSAIAVGVFLAAGPTFYWSLPHGIDVGVYRAHTLPASLALVPAGLLVLLASFQLIAPLAAPWRRLSCVLLGQDPAPLHASASASAERHAGPRALLARALTIHAATVAGLSLALIIVWALTSRGYFWPAWPLFVALMAVGAHAATLLLRSRDRAALTERISALESSRAGAVDVQESELRRIERDLHDGAQARLVALGMSIGMAEQKLDTDADAARELLAEARTGAGEALRELRDLARGIHPPVLADRGLGAAVRALAAVSPMAVTVAVVMPERPKAPVESAAYFVVAEALANASKHAHAARVDVRIMRSDDELAVEIHDDGVGGANADGSGLEGLRRRVEALDGTLAVISPPGGPTTIRAELPCG